MTVDSKQPFQYLRCERAFGLVEVLIIILLLTIIGVIITNNAMSTRVNTERNLLLSSVDRISIAVSEFNQSHPMIDSKDPLTNQDIHKDPLINQDDRDERRKILDIFELDADSKDHGLFSSSGKPLIRNWPEFHNDQIQIDRRQTDMCPTSISSTHEVGVLFICRITRNKDGESVGSGSIRLIAFAKVGGDPIIKELVYNNESL